tara:strand:- start:462 stop:677 length:216 start_codon:yes stop_codon:yes gene_type:complete
MAFAAARSELSSTTRAKMAKAGEIPPVVAETYPLRDLHAAQLAFLEKSHMGKIGVAISGGPCQAKQWRYLA